MRRSRWIITAVLLVLGGRIAAAQAQAGPFPGAGTWGGESGGLGGGSLLMFQDANSALVLGANVLVARDKSETTGAGGTTTDEETSTLVDLRAGYRLYGAARDRIRTYSTISAIVGIGTGTLKRTRGGAGYEMGIAYFFTRNFSAALAGEVTLTYNKTETSAGTFSSKRTSIQLSAAGPRVVGALYF